MAENLVDIHTHVLPDVDDGPKDWEGSLEMLRRAAETGTRLVAATSHQPGGWRGPRPVLPAVRALVEALNARARQAGIPVRVVPGAEIYLTEEAADLVLAGELPTLNDTRYVLVEFGFDEWPANVEQSVRRLVDAGYWPVVAHPERYRVIQEAPSRLYPFLEMGCLLQVNATSLTGYHGRDVQRLAVWLFEQGYAHCVASDAHNAHSRPPVLSGARDELARRFGEAVAEAATALVPAAILAGEAVPTAVRCC